MSTSIGYSSNFNGFNGAFSVLAKDATNSGGAIRGWIPKMTQNVDKRFSEYENIRFALKNAWNTNQRQQLAEHNLKKSITTPFRAANNAGDLLSRKNFSCGGTCQTYQSRPGLKGLSNSFGGVSNSCVPSSIDNQLQMLPNVPAAACNVKYVYDSSDYVRYLKQKATLKNYNDFSYGGDNSKASQSKLRAIRRY
jgi:hypothetical protein